MEIILKIDEKNDQAMAFYQYIKTLPFIELKDKKSYKISQSSQIEDEIIQISKSINKKGAKKWFAKKGIQI